MPGKGSKLRRKLRQLEESDHNHPPDAPSAKEPRRSSRPSTQASSRAESYAPQVQRVGEERKESNHADRTSLHVSLMLLIRLLRVLHHVLIGISVVSHLVSSKDGWPNKFENNIHLSHLLSRHPLFGSRYTTRPLIVAREYGRVGKRYHIGVEMWLDWVSYSFRWVYHCRRRSYCRPRMIRKSDTA